MITMFVVSLWCRHGLLAYVYNGVSLTRMSEVAGNGSYIVRPCGHDLQSDIPFCPSKIEPVLACA